MKKLSIVCLAVVMAVVFGYGSAFADPSAKATCQAGDLSSVTSESYVNIFTQTIHTANDKALLMDVSLECGLTTDTKVASKLLGKAEATAEAIVKVRVLVDPVFGTTDDGVQIDDEVLNLEDAVALPGIVEYNVAGELTDDGGIFFARRHQTMIAHFAGDISNALSIAADGTTIVIDPTLVAPETLQLILDTMTANSFGFVYPGLSAGTHTVVVQANLMYQDAVAGEGLDGTEGISSAYLGKGSVTVESTRFIKNENVEL